MVVVPYNKGKTAANWKQGQLRWDSMPQERVTLPEQAILQ